MKKININVQNVMNESDARCCVTNCVTMRFKSNRQQTDVSVVGFLVVFAVVLINILIVNININNNNNNK